MQGRRQRRRRRDDNGKSNDSDARSDNIQRKNNNACYVDKQQRLRPTAASVSSAKVASTCPRRAI